MLFRKRIILKEIKIKNFKSFKTTDIKLGNFNVLIGANASGKSNFVQIFNFLQDIQKHGLDNAISLQGGVEFIQNFKIGVRSNLMFEIRLAFPSNSIIPLFEPHDVIATDLVYNFEIHLGKKSGFKIINDKAIFTCKINKKSNSKPKSGHVTITKHNQKIKIDDTFNLKFINTTKYIRMHLFKNSSKSLLLESIFFSQITHPTIYDFINTISIYDFYPKLAKKTVPLIGTNVLKNDGSNLAIILKKINEDKGKRRKFLNLIHDLIPYVKNTSVDKFIDTSISFNFKENYFKDRKLPPNLISDGTINITALIIALYFQNNTFTILEEPERNIHPSLIANMVEMMKDASSSRQVLVTTHNPEIVKYVGVDNIYLVTRDDKGFSNIVKPSDSDTVQQFLKNKMGIEELYVQNLLNS